MTLPALSRLGDRAVRYAENGWYVFPLQPRGKQPIQARGFLAASADVAVVRSCWTQYPNANIGLWPGRSQLLIIDLDGPEGEANGRALGLLAEPTLEVRTGRENGGRHLYFRRPGFFVSNAAIAKSIDVRCDKGYVILPPSVHPSGRQYQWLGKIDEVHDLPPNALELLERAQSGTVSTDAGTVLAAREIALEPEIGQGERNNTLTRYAGRLLSKGIPEEETLALVSALNQAKCNPPLPQVEINTMVQGLAVKESAKRVTTTGQTLALVDEEAAAVVIRTPADVISQQVEGARALLDRPIADAPRWSWNDLDAVVGPMLPGDLVVVGSLMGNGKSTLLMSQMDAFAAKKTPTLYIPLEVDPEVCRLRWAAWRLGIDVRAVVRQEWATLPEGSREAIENTLEEQEHDPFVHFAPPKRMTPGELLAWCEWARKEFNCRVVMLDHIHRMNFGPETTFHRVTVTDVIRKLKDMARDLELVLIAAAQLNRSSDPIDQYSAPLLSRLKESAGIGEEADVVLMLSRKLQHANLPPKWMNLLRMGKLSEREIADPGVMTVTCRKHRLDDEAMNARVYLSIRNGRVEDRAYTWRQSPPEQTRWEPE